MGREVYDLKRRASPNTYGMEIEIRDKSDFAQSEIRRKSEVNLASSNPKLDVNSKYFLCTPSRNTAQYPLKKIDDRGRMDDGHEPILRPHVAPYITIQRVNAS